MRVVTKGYRLHTLGIPRQPDLGTWIHMLPIKDYLLGVEERKLCQQLSMAFFWVIYLQLHPDGAEMN